MDDRSYHQSGAPGSLHLGPPQPLEVNIARARAFVPPLGSSQVGFSGPRGPILPIPAVSQVHFASNETIPGSSGRNPLRSWYEERDGPWVGVRFEGHRHGNKNNGPSPRQASQTSGFMDYRGSGEPSECDTSPGGCPPSDSGYASAPRPSVGHRSVYGDGDASGDTQSMVGRTAELRLSQGSSAGKKDPIRCETCDELVKTPSELKYVVSPTV